MEGLRNMPESWNKLSNSKLLESIGEAVRAMRLKLNWTQSELAKSAGISLPSLVRLESGNGNPSLTVLLSLLKALGQADGLELVFAAQDSPLLVAQGNKSHGRMRARASHKANSVTLKNQPENKLKNKPGFSWGEDK